MLLNPLEMVDPAATARLIRTSIAERRPFSFIRLGDGEGALAAFTDKSRLEDLAYFQMHFGPDVSIREIEQIRDHLEEAIASADLIGVRDDVVNVAPQAATLNPSDKDFHEQFRTLFALRQAERNIKAHAARRIFQSFQRVRKGLPTRATICSQWICYDLAKLGFWDSLLSDIGRVGLITSSTTLQARLTRRFNLDVEALVVPQAVIDGARPRGSAEWQFPQAYQRVRSALERPLHGQLFLVGAGLVGKHYLHLIKQNGGIALDVGALLDAWDGYATRGLIYSTKTPLQASPFSAPADFRLGPGRLAITGHGKKPRLVLHAGFSKTGTTAIQSALANHQQTFFDLGVNYVRAGRGSAINHHKLARAFGMGEAGMAADRPVLAGLLRDIAAETASLPHMIHVISSELFTNTSPNLETEDDLIEFLNGYDLRIVVMVRNQYDWLLSWHAQAAGNRNMELLLSDFLLKPTLLEKFDGNFLRKIDWFEKYAPKGAVRVLSYDEHRRNPLAALADAVPMPKPNLELQIENASPPPSHTVAGIAARRLGVSLKSLLNVEWPPGVVDELMLLGTHCTKRDALRTEIMKRFADVNATISARYAARIDNQSTKS